VIQLLISSRSSDFGNVHRVELLLCWRWCKRESILLVRYPYLK